VPDFPGFPARSTKTTLRNQILTARRALPGVTLDAAAARLRAEVVGLVRRLQPAVVAGYAPVGAEPGGPDLPAAVAAALDPAGALLLPVLRPDLDLDWARYAGPDRLAPSGRGLREPTGPRLGRAALRRAALVLVPALAVDAAGRRLGRGAGCYDRALARVAPDAPVVALLHDGELRDDLPAEAHDRAVHAVITPAGGLRWLGPGPTTGRHRPG